MSAEKYPSIFLRQMEAFVYIVVPRPIAGRQALRRRIRYEIVDLVASWIILVKLNDSKIERSFIVFRCSMLSRSP